MSNLSYLPTSQFQIKAEMLHRELKLLMEFNTFLLLAWFVGVVTGAAGMFFLFKSYWYFVLVALLLGGIALFLCLWKVFYLVQRETKLTLDAILAEVALVEKRLSDAKKRNRGVHKL